MRKNKTKILVAMSGGVDSSVAAALLVRAGFDVTGMFAVNYDESKADGQSCWREDYQDALRVCAKLGIQLLRWDFVKEYRRDVLTYMYREYEGGRTPNPDVLCNKFIKFGAWLKRAKQKKFDIIATGHYARTLKTKKQTALLVAKDTNKDQTYFLHQLSQKQLSCSMFPLGDYTKSEVRVLAKKFKLPTAQKAESMGICFVGEVPMRVFLKKRVKSKPGNIITADGTIIGKHDGLPFYTIGERIGIKSQPFFVVEKKLKNNLLVVACENDNLLYKKEILVQNPHWISGLEPKLPLRCLVRLRHRQILQKCVIEKNKERPRGVLIKFQTIQRAVTPGQFAVLYKNNNCLGGGVVV